MSSLILKKDLILYGLFAIPLAFAGIPLYIYASDYYVTEYKVSLLSLGLALLIVRLFDAVQDPLIGYYSDKYSKHRLHIIAVASIFLAGSFSLLFMPLVAYLLWFTVFSFLATFAFSIISININALGGIWSRNKHEKTVIVSYRETLGLIGLILAVSLPGILQNNMNISKQNSFLIMSLLLGFFTVISFLSFYFFTRRNPLLGRVSGILKFRFKNFLNIEKPTRKLLRIYTLNALAISISSVLVIFFIRDRLKLESYTGLFLLLYFLAAVIHIPLWNYISEKIGKKKTWFISMTLSCSFTGMYFIQDGAFWHYLIICTICGISFGADLLMPASILSDHIQSFKKENYASTYFSIFAFLSKFALTIAATLSFVFLHYASFVPDTINTGIAYDALNFSYSLLPVSIRLVAMYFLWRFIVSDRKEQKEAVLLRS